VGRWQDGGLLEAGYGAEEYAERVGRACQQVEYVQAVVRGEGVGVGERPVRPARLFAGHLGLALSEAGREVSLPLSGRRHERRDGEPQRVLGTHHDVTVAFCMPISHMGCES
jgi:hypothetical protein